MSSLIQRVVRQAKLTFFKRTSDDAEMAKLHKLVQLLTADDVGINAQLFQRLPQHNAPVFYIPVYDHEDFTIAIFILKQGCRIPLHNHPGMVGLLKVLYGSARIESYSPSGQSNQQQQRKGFSFLFGNDDRTTVSSERGLHAVRHDPIIVASTDEPCRLSPDKGNIHEVIADKGPVAFLDVLAPPYDNGARDCVYYSQQPQKVEDTSGRCFLEEIPAPTDFWCKKLPYQGPEIEDGDRRN